MSQRFQSRLLLIGLIALGLIDCVQAAPAAKPKPLMPLAQYIPDDASFVLIANVKSFLDGTKNKKDIEKWKGMLTAFGLQEYLQGFGITSIEDLERFCVIGTPQKDATLVERSMGPIWLLQGQFDQDKFNAAGDRAAKDNDDSAELQIKKLKIRETRVYEIQLGIHNGYICLLDPVTVIVTKSKKMIEEAIDRGLDKKRTKVKNLHLAKWMEDREPNEPIKLIALGHSVVGITSSSDVRNGQRVETSKSDTLEDAGIEVVKASLCIEDRLRTKVVVEAKSADQAKEVAKFVNIYFASEMKQAEKVLEELIQKEKKPEQEEEKSRGLVEKAKASVKNWKSIKISTAETTITIDGRDDLFLILWTGIFVF